MPAAPLIVNPGLSSHPTDGMGLHPVGVSQPRPDPHAARILSRQRGIPHRGRRGPSFSSIARSKPHLFRQFGVHFAAVQPISESFAGNNLVMAISSVGLEHPLYGGNHALEIGALMGQPFTSGCRDGVKAGTSIILGCPPFGHHPAV